MQIKNTHPPIRLTGRHVTITEAMDEYARRRIAALHLDYPTILEVHVILRLEKYRRRADIILRCNRHITIKTSSETDDMYASIDQAIDRTARQMRKYHTRLMCAGLARRKSVRRVRSVRVNQRMYYDPPLRSTDERFHPVFAAYSHPA